MQEVGQGFAGSERAAIRGLATLALVLFALFGSACSSGGTTDSTAPRYYEDVAPLLNRNCVGCHQSGGIAPFALTSYDEVRGRASEIALATSTRTMPPMPVDNSGSCNTYSNARWLSDAEIALLGQWVKGGTPAGDAAKAPALPGPLPTLAAPDAVLDTGVSYLPDSAGATDDYRCFVVAAASSEFRYLTQYEVLPGDPRVVHHVIVYQPDNEAEAQAAHDLDSVAAGDGYPCFGGPGVQASPLAMWAPGAGAISLPSGTGVPVAAKRDLVIQIHYNLENGSFPDRTRVALVFANQPVLSALYLPVANQDMRLAPGRANVESMASQTLDALKLTVYGAMPHMHTLGRTLRVDVQDSGESRCLVDVDRWDFHWQNAWWYDAPLVLEKASALSIRCGFDTSSKTTEVTWGENTSDEMCISYLYVTLRDAPDPVFSCDDAANPLFGSCLDAFFSGCFEPDLSGSCTSDSDSVSWSDGSKAVSSGAAAGIYAPGSSDPCITLAPAAGGLLLAKGSQQLTYTPKGDSVTFRCPDGSALKSSGFQLTEYNRCRGLNCPN